MVILSASGIEAILKNFTIRNGNGDSFGGGIKVYEASPVLDNLIIENSQSAASSSINEAVQMKFGLSGTTDAGVIRVTKEEDFMSANAQSANMTFYTKVDGTSDVRLRIDRSAVETPLSIIAGSPGNITPNHKMEIWSTDSKTLKLRRYNLSTFDNTTPVGMSFSAKELPGFISALEPFSIVSPTFTF